MYQNLKKFLPLAFIPLFGGGLALHAALALQLFGIASLERHTVICFVIFEAVFFITSFICELVIMSRLATNNNTNKQIEMHYERLSK